MATAVELFTARHYPGVVAVCSGVLDADPDCVDMLLLRARAHLALRRDGEAHADLRNAVRIDPGCAVAFRLLGELSARKNEDDAAAVFFREALRLAPGDPSAADWLAIVASSAPPTVRDPVPDDERRTRAIPRMRAHGRAASPSVGSSPRAQPPRAAFPRADSRGPVPELPGFAEYLIDAGIVSRDDMRAAQGYRRAMNVSLSSAITALGLASQQRVEWAAVTHQSKLAQQTHRARTERAR